MWKSFLSKNLSLWYNKASTEWKREGIVLKKFLQEWGIYFLIVLVFLLIRFFVFVPVSVSGHSMDPTLADGQRLIVNKLAKVERFAIVTTKEPDAPETIAVKRVIGLPGDTVKMQGDVLTINGKTYDEPYLDAFKQKFAKDKLQTEYAYDPYFQKLAQNTETFTSDFEITVPQDAYFVLGDDRIVSKDSRIFGVVESRLIQGKVSLRYWPFKQFHLF